MGEIYTKGMTDEEFLRYVVTLDLPPIAQEMRDRIESLINEVDALIDACKSSE